jgi:hypothetical protein
MVAKTRRNRVGLGKALLGMLEEDLSHLEFLGSERGVKIRQRNIYDGSMVEVTPSKKGFGLKTDTVKEFGPVGIRTNDFLALFSFQDSIQITFLPPKFGFAYIRGDRFGMEGMVAYCSYDEMYKVGDVNGRKK